MSLHDRVRSLGAKGGSFGIGSLDVPADYSGDIGEINWLLRDPMAHAGLDVLDVYIELYEDGEKIRGLPDAAERPAHNPALWFVEIVEGLCIFGADGPSCVHVDAMMTDMASAVAAAFAAHHTLSYSHEALVDALGFVR